MEATPFCLLLNKLHLFSQTQNRFILIQIAPLNVCYMFRSVLRPSTIRTLVDLQTSNRECVCLRYQGLTEQVTEMSILEFNHAVADRHRKF
jgi:hypothetical protein